MSSFEPPQSTGDEQLLEQLAQGRFSFLDLGCGAGRSIAYLEKRFDLPSGAGIGVDISPAKIREAKRSGAQVLLADVTSTEFPEQCVSFISMLDFLEHLSSKQHAIGILKRSALIAKDFLFIRHPSFEDIDYLRQFDLKLDWTDWGGHRNMMLIADYREIFKSLNWKTFVVIPQKQILDSTHSAILPISAPSNTLRYDEAVHTQKPLVYFDRPVWTQFDIFVRLNPNMSEDFWQKVIYRFHAPTELEAAGQGLTKARNKLAAAEQAYLDLKQKKPSKVISALNAHRWD